MLRRNDQPAVLRSHGLDMSVVAEFIGVLLFQVLAGSIGDSPVATAFTYAGLLYAVSFVQGAGHLNPAVSLATAASGHVTWVKGFTLIVAQVLGAIVGACLQVFIVPGTHFGQTDADSCFSPISAINGTQLYIWETLLTFFFVLVVYVCLFYAPGHGSVSPVAVGITLLAILSTGGTFTGYSPVNPARIIAGSVVFNCFWRFSWIYLLGEFTGAGLACLVVFFLLGEGPVYGSRGNRVSGLTQGLLGNQQAEA